MVLGGALSSGYSHMTQTISELGGAEAEYAILQNINFLLLGFVVIGFGWVLSVSRGGAFLGPALVGFFGLSSAIANGLLPCDAGCKGQTTVGLLHNITGLAGFVAVIAGMFVLARLWHVDPAWRSHALFTRRTTFVALVGLIGFVATQAMDVDTVDGLLQRIFVAAILVWITTTALRLYRERI